MDGKYVLLLSIILIVYLCLGAGLFLWTESSKEKSTKEETYIKYDNFLTNNTCVDAEDLNNLLQAIVTTSSQYGGFKAVKKSRNSTAVIWDFTGAFTFSVTIVTTIGYGHTHPVTVIGKMLCVAYALFGIPLTLMVLGGIGEKLSALSSKAHRLELNPDSPSANRWINMALLVGGGLLVMFIIPSSVFCSLENWHIIDSVYYCFVTLSTIGFGDYVAGIAPNNDEPFRTIYRIAVYVWIFMGLSYISLVIKSLSKIFVKRAKKVQKNALKRVATQNFPFMNGITIMNGTALGKRAMNSSGRQSNPADSFEESTEDADSTDTTRDNAASTSDIQTMQLSSAPTTKCRVQLKDVIDLVGPNSHDIKLISVSNIEPRF